MKKELEALERYDCDDEYYRSFHKIDDYKLLKSALEVLDIIGNELLKNADIDLTEFGYEKLTKNFAIMKWLKEKEREMMK